MVAVAAKLSLKDAVDFTSLNAVDDVACGSYFINERMRVVQRNRRKSDNRLEEQFGTAHEEFARVWPNCDHITEDTHPFPHIHHLFDGDAVQ